MAAKRTNQQSLQGRLCVSLYQELGEAVLPVISRVYRQYGQEVGQGLAAKWQPAGPAQAAEKFAEMANAAGLPTQVEMVEQGALFTGGKCPFGLENTNREVCQAMMAMDEGLFGALTGKPAEEVDLDILESLAAGDGRCRTLLKF